jgi:hypothetical protein
VENEPLCLPDYPSRYRDVDEMNGDHEEVRYAVKVIGSQVVGADGKIFTHDGEEFWVCDDEWGPSGSNTGNGGMPPNVMTFKNKDDARHFAGQWEGHPWWVKPKDWRIVEIVPRYIQSGWVIK